MLRRIMSTFFDRWKFRHPSPDDFFDVANKINGQNLDWFFDQVYGGSNVFDYGVHELKVQPASARGFFTEKSGQTPVFMSESDGQGIFQTTVIVRRYGEAIFPVEVLTIFEDGETVREHRDGQARWKAFTYERPARTTRTHIDPERVLLLDFNNTNNSKSTTPRTEKATTKWMLTWMIWLQDLVLTYAFFV